MTIECDQQIVADAAWLARLARGSSWPGEMAQRVEAAAERVTAWCERSGAVLPDRMLTRHIERDYRPGSNSATWDEEDAAMRARLCLCCGQAGHYQQQLEEHIAASGLDQGVLLGDDGRLRDGHHRLIAARRLGIEWVPLETEQEAKQRWLRDHGPVDWLGRKKGAPSAIVDGWVFLAAGGITFHLPPDARVPLAPEGSQT